MTILGVLLIAVFLLIGWLLRLERIAKRNGTFRSHIVTSPPVMCCERQSRNWR
jgi:hypothetical protein